MEPSFNPVVVGKDNKLNVVGAYTLDFAGYEHNPNTFYVGADMPIYFMKQYHGVGISILNDKLGAFVHQRVAGQYAFRKELWSGMLSAGVQVGMPFEKLDGSKLEEGSDPALTQGEVNGHGLDLNALLNTTSSYPQARKYNNRQCLDRPHPSAKCPPVARLSPPHIAPPAYMLTDKG